MGKKSGIFITIIIIIIILIFLISLKFTGYLIKEQEKQVQFYFYDEFTNCSLEAYVFSGEKLIGKSQQGIFNLTYENYKDNFQNKKEISVFGRLGPCFNENSDLLFDKYWEPPKIEDYYFSGESIFNFKTTINPHNPTKRELIGFVQPLKIKSELSKINLKGDILDDLSKINQYLNNKISYVKDWDFNKETNYWQTPLETLEIKQGDCEDYSTALLSLFLAYNSSLNCYNIVFSSHVTTFCHINNYYIYYDQEKTELKKQINKINTEEAKSQLEKLKQDYFEHYGINNTNKNESMVHHTFNDNQYIEFSDENDFINWQYSLENKKQEFSSFEELEKQATEIQEKYPATNKAELATQQPLATEKPSTSLATQKPTIKGFITENLLMFISLSIIFIVLIIVLIKINIKKN
jgi:hypothetical protein